MKLKKLIRLEYVSKTENIELIVRKKRRIK
jgi:hypothetical protein